MLGGAIGAGARWMVGRWALHAFGPAFPWGTLGVNLAGGLLMGLLVGVLAAKGASEAVRSFLGVGVLGGFTTFSAFSLELVQMLERGQAGLALGYALASVIGAGVALGAGLAVARAW